MSNVKYQIFVSSTYEDLKSERDQVVKAILEMGHIPVGMEMFSAADEDQWSLITNYIRSSDYYVVLLAERYGSLDVDGRGFTEKEYDYAVSENVPALGFILASGSSWPVSRVDKDTKQRESLDKFKAKVKSRYVSFWNSSEDLYGRVSVALMKQMAAHPRIGWMRADQAVSPQLASELARLSQENAELRRKLEAATAAQKEIVTPVTAWRRFFLVLGKYAGIPMPAEQQYRRDLDVREALERLRFDLDLDTAQPTELLARAESLVNDSTTGWNIPVDGDAVAALRARVFRSISKDDPSND